MIAYERTGAGTPVVCLHGWPGASSDYRELVGLLEPLADVVVPDLVGFGASFTPSDVERPPSEFGRDAQVDAVLGLIDSLDLDEVVLVGYDLGSSAAIALARRVPDRVRGLVLGNPVHPGAARLALEARQRSEFWYQDFHQLDVASSLIDGKPEAVRSYLGHIWGHWGARPVASVDGVTDALVASYARPGAFTVSLNWYRSGSGMIATALDATSPSFLPPRPVSATATVLWGALDPIFPPAFAEGLSDTLTRHELRMLDDVGHFVPLEAAAETADAVRAHL